ncbi:site-specific DNA-methyltransferase [Stenotrophomonas sp. W1S232]|uniref:site-specific DNA-methyltransferase (adenine-specific) n=1 Tax=Stenotrophomonas koreensis TaxID=266128 RepID=A0A7W3YV96_9GAMM|nr:site-specific DNA-methyltransferase [Stenotrophomonas koreensis]MBB1116688.1 site-specific DNA-methyltransferase [Stenotrophomonas koreensis]
MATATVSEIRTAILTLLKADGTSMGNQSLRQLIADTLQAEVEEADYVAARDALVAEGQVVKGKGRGGSVARAVDADAPLTLSIQEKPVGADAPKPQQATMTLAQAKKAKEAVAAKKGEEDAQVIAYQHEQKRKNNPDVGVVTPDNDPAQPKTAWAYDPHIDPALQFDVRRAQIETLIDDALASGDTDTMRAALEQLKRQAAPYLNWAGKAERTSFEVDTVSLHVHERIDPATILGVIQKRIKQDKGEHGGTADMFRAWFEEPLPHREAVDFYKHDRGWSNRLVAGDSLLVMNSLLQKEGMAGQVQMIYIDPPYGIKYGSNFQPFVNKRDVKDRKDEDLTQEPEMIKAFRDTWELGIHSYLTYLRDRLLLAKELLHESGSVFVQISDENVHFVRNVLDEVFGKDAFFAEIPFKKTSSLGSSGLDSINDYLIWYAKDARKVKFNRIYLEMGEDTYAFPAVEMSSGEWKRLTVKEKKSGVFSGKLFRTSNITSQSGGDNSSFGVELRGEEFKPSANSYWKTGVLGMSKLARAGRLLPVGNTLTYKRYSSDFPVRAINNWWDDTIQSTFAIEKDYVVQTYTKVVERCLLMATDPSDLVLDPTCGSGTTAFVAEKWGRRWITCDTSRVAVTLAKQRLMTASYDYYELKYPHEGLRGGFIYKTVPHVTLKSIANNPEIDEIYERLHPAIEQALVQLNAVLSTAGAPFKVTEGGRKGELLDLAKGDVLQEWEVPFNFPDNWQAAARAPFEAFHAARQAMQKKMDASIAAHADQETLFDQPAVSKDKLRITGPFTVEAVPFPTVLSLDESPAMQEADTTIARSGESHRQHSWRDELLKTGIRGKGGQMLKFAELDTLPDMPNLHCSGHLVETGERVVVSFGPEHGALEQRQVELAMREASELFPRPKMIVFCAFTFDPEAAKDIDATKGITALKVQMNTDLLTEDLKKARSSNQSFWLMGQPDVDVRQRKDGKYEVEVKGFDYFDTASGELKSGGKKNIAAWSLDTDYDDRSLFPRQVFFPMAGAKDGWNKLKKDIKAELDETKLDKLHGTISLPFEPGENRKIAVKIVDDRGIESLKVMALG